MAGASAERREPRVAVEETPYPPSGYAWFVVFVLMILYVFSFLDRTILNLMVEPIKRDLGIDDFQMSLLMGASFAVFYSILGLPIGRLADATNRKRLIAVGLIVWTMMTAWCGLARTYVQFFFLRVGVGAGEATLSPSAYSMVADYFPREKLGRALSFYSMGIFIGAGLAVGIGGIVTGWAMRIESVELPVYGAIYSWQLVFIVVGLAGLAPLLLLLVVKEPVRRGAGTVAGKVTTVPLKEFFRYLNENRKTITCHHVGFAILAFSSYGVGYWGPTFMIRIHEWPYERIGVLFMVHVIVAGCGGIIAGGYLGDWLLRKGHEDAPMKVGLLACILWIPTGIAYPLVSNGWVAWALMIPTYFFTTFPTGMAASAVQNIMPNPMRGQASALYLFVANLIGQAMGPSAVGFLTAYVFRDDMKLPYSMVIVGVVCHVVGIAVFAMGQKPFRESVERLEDWKMPADRPSP